MDDQSNQEAPAGTTPRMPFVVAGTWRFMLISVAGFAPWACAGHWFHRNFGEGGLYVACLIAFLIAALVLLPSLIDGPRRWWRGAKFFVPAFTAYAVLWCACWFLLGGRAGEWTGAIVGGATFTLITAWVLGWPRSFPLTLLVVLTLQIAGYFSGGAAMAVIADDGRPGMVGMFAWGLCYGFGFGAALGWLVHACTAAKVTSPVG